MRNGVFHCDQSNCRIVEFFQLLKRDALLNRKLSGSCPTQPDEMGTRADLTADVLGECADVCPGGANYSNADLELDPS